MVLAALRDDTYNLFLFLHILAVIIAFAPAVLNPMLERYFAKSGGEPVLQNWAQFTATYTRTFALGGVVSAMILKGEKMMAAGNMKGAELVAKGGPIATVLALITLYLMIWKPGA